MLAGTATGQAISSAHTKIAPECLPELRGLRAGRAEMTLRPGAWIDGA